MQKYQRSPLQKMGANLIEQLRQVKDFRVKDEQRHQLWMTAVGIALTIFCAKMVIPPLR
ncbi:hypothetical protein [Nostoc sp.]|uniref:hypothetical protein n=1 Tax=Nostoc sp. TaxID=1180 RepID=UPI0035930659